MVVSQLRVIAIYHGQLKAIYLINNVTQVSVGAIEQVADKFMGNGIDFLHKVAHVPVEGKRAH